MKKKKGRQEWWVECRRGRVQKSREQIDKNLGDSDGQSIDSSRFGDAAARNRQSLPLSSNIRQKQPVRTWLSLSCKKPSAVSRRDLVTRAPDAEETKIQSQGRSTVTDSPLVENVIVFLPLDAASRTERPAGPCETQSFARQLQVSNFCSTEIGLCCQPL